MSNFEQTILSLYFFTGKGVEKFKYSEEFSTCSHKNLSQLYISRNSHHFKVFTIFIPLKTVELSPFLFTDKFVQVFFNK